MKLNRATAATAGFAVAGVAVLSGFALPHQAITATRPASTVSASKESAHHAKGHPAPARPSASPAMAWLESAGGQAQVTFNDDVDTLAADLQTESHSPTIANHLAFEADARTVRAQAERILSDPALLPAVNRAGYEHMLSDFIVVANLLQPGPGYGTTAQDDAAWNTAITATNTNIS